MEVGIWEKATKIKISSGFYFLVGLQAKGSRNIAQDTRILCYVLQGTLDGNESVGKDVVRWNTLAE